MFRYLIIEDEEFASAELERMIKVLQPTFQLVYCTKTIEDSISFLNKNTVDLIFSDIRLSDGYSFEIFQQVVIDTPIIFTTAYDEFAIKAFKFNSIDYLLIPIEESDLSIAIDKFKNKNISPFSYNNIENIEKLFKPQNKRKRFLVHYGDIFSYVDVEDVAFIYSEEKAVILHTFENNRYIIDSSLSQLENELDASSFFRVSRNCIANIKSVQKIVRYFNSRLKLYFSPECPHEVLVSRERVPDFLLWIDGKTT